MIRKAFGATGVGVPAIGQGTWDLPESGARLLEAKRAIRRGITLGMTHIDTAEMYGGGAVEEVVGDAIAGLSREQLFITGKVLPSHADFAGTMAACERSLRRLRIEYFDLFLLHWPSRHPLTETMGALEALVEQGKTRFVGVSNFDVDAMLAAQAHLKSVPLACNQVLYHLHERGIEYRLEPRARERGIAIVAYTPFGRGTFPTAGSRGYALLARIADKHGATPRQVALAFLTREPNVFTIPKAASLKHLEENAGAGDLVLDDHDVREIDLAFPRAPEGALATL